MSVTVKVTMSQDHTKGFLLDRLVVADMGTQRYVDQRSSWYVIASRFISPASI